jgi:hypothetical protein
MREHTNRRRATAPMRVALTSLLVVSGIGVVGVVPALAADDSPALAAFDSDHDRGRERGHERWFRDRGDLRYVWFRVCDTTATGATTSTTSATTAAATSTETVAPDAIAAAVEGAAVEGAAVETATTTDTGTTTETTSATTAVDEDDPDAEAYPTFVVVPLPKDEARAIRRLDERPCYDLTTRAPQTTTPTTDAATTDTAPTTETTTATPADTAVG